MSKQEKLLIFSTACFALLSLLLGAFLIKAQEENKKYETILDIACQYSGSEKQCRNGLEMFKNMSTSEINKYRLDDYMIK